MTECGTEDEGVPPPDQNNGNLHNNRGEGTPSPDQLPAGWGLAVTARLLSSLRGGWARSSSSELSCSGSAHPVGAP